MDWQKKINAIRERVKDIRKHYPHAKMMSGIFSLVDVECLLAAFDDAERRAADAERRLCNSEYEGNIILDD